MTTATEPDADATPAGPEEEPEARKRTLRLFADSPALILFVLLVLVGVFSALRPDAFASAATLGNIAISSSGLLVMAVAMTYVILTAGIDLSIGSVLVLSGVVAVRVMESIGDGQGWGVALAGIGVALLTGLAVGLLNGFLIAKARIPAFIVTLGTLGAALGSAQLISGGTDLRGVPRVLVAFGGGRIAGVPNLVLVALAVTLVGGIVLQFTRFGRYTYAIGSNPEAARRAGINVDRHLLAIYALSGLLAGLASVISMARFTNTTINGHGTDNLQVIAAVVIGGTSLFGGVAGLWGVVGSLVGVLIPSVLTFGFVILRVEPFWQTVAVGIVLVAAVYVDQLKRSARERL
jgi:ribose transport system permease protein